MCKGGQASPRWGPSQGEERVAPLPRATGGSDIQGCGTYLATPLEVSQELLGLGRGRRQAPAPERPARVPRQGGWRTRRTSAEDAGAGSTPSHGASRRSDHTCGRGGGCGRPFGSSCSRDGRRPWGGEAVGRALRVRAATRRRRRLAAHATSPSRRGGSVRGTSRRC